MLFSDEIRRRENRRRRRSVWWGIASLVLHSALFTAIILLTPVKSLVFEDRKKEKSSPASDLSADRIEEIAQSLSDVRKNELEDRLEVLQTVLHNMDLMKEQLQIDYDEFAADSAEEVKRDIGKLLDQAEKSMEDAEREREPVMEKAEKILAEERKELDDEARAKTLREASTEIMLSDGEKIVESQAKAGNALDRAHLQAAFAGYKKVSEAAVKLRDEQVDAGKKQYQSQKDVSETARKLSELHGRKRDLDNHKKWLAEQQERLERAQNDQADAKQRKTDAEKKRDEAAASREAAQAAEKELRQQEREATAEVNSTREQINRLRDEQRRDRRDSAKYDKLQEQISAKDKSLAEMSKQAKELRAKADAERNNANQRNREFHQESNRVNHEQRRIDQNIRTEADAKRRIEDLERKIAEREEQLAEVEAVRKEKVNESQIENLREAAKAQDALRSRVDSLRKILSSDAPELQPLTDENRAENELVGRDAAVMTMSDAYELARELESSITESYKDLKATQMAIERKMSFEEAQKITDVAKAVRMEADREAVESDPRTKEALDAQKAAQAAVVRETDNIVEVTLAMMEEAMTIVKPDGGRDSGEKSKGRLSDRVQWLKNSDFASRSGKEARSERLAQMKSAAAYQLAITSAAAEDESMRAKDVASVARQGRSANAKPGGTRGGPAYGSTGEVARSGRGGNGGGPGTVDPRMPELMPGNVMRLSGDPAGALPGKWMYVNSWYVIGPFPNPDRINLHRKFPPDSVIDLDASYIGKGGRTVKWEYMQARSTLPRHWWRADSKAEVVPYNAEEYGIWYAYAEVFSDIECDRWIAVGSDDRSDIWINDIPVWGSSNKLKSWRIDEGYRKVHFRKGRNRILARVENGWHVFGWSVCISLYE